MNIGEVRNIDGKPALITAGQYMGTYGVSNFWYWRYINEDGSLGAEDNGYDNGSRVISKPIKHDVRIIL